MRDGDPLDEVKRLLGDRYLGVAGIHGLGLNRTAGAVRVYCDLGDSAEQQLVLEQLRRDAAPFKVEIVPSPLPQVG